MKLASLKHGRDGRLVVVSRDLTRCAPADAIAPTLQAALDDWAAAEPRLRAAFEALEAAQRQGSDLLLIDTAGRLHNKADLMAELQKIVRVLRKLDPAAPHDVLLVLDATTGQNAHAQVETFKELVNVTGLVVTKLDGSARGGVLVALAERLARESVV